MIANDDYIDLKGFNNGRAVIARDFYRYRVKAMVMIYRYVSNSRFKHSIPSMLG